MIINSALAFRIAHLNDRYSPFSVNLELDKIFIQEVIPLESNLSLTVSGSLDFGEG